MNGYSINTHYYYLFIQTDWNAKEDDEICAELRKLGHDLKEQVKINEFHKKRLLQVVDCQLQFEQYRHVLDTLDSQVEQCYMKRFVSWPLLYLKREILYCYSILAYTKIKKTKSKCRQQSNIIRKRSLCNGKAKNLDQCFKRYIQRQKFDYAIQIYL